jgi:hypothetical protein
MSDLTPAFRRALHQLQRHIDIAAGRVRLRAHDVREVDQRLRLIGPITAGVRSDIQTQPQP